METLFVEHPWKIRSWIQLTASTQYLKTNSFATFPMHTNEKFQDPFEGKLKTRNNLLWNFISNYWIHQTWVLMFINIFVQNNKLPCANTRKIIAKDIFKFSLNYYYSMEMPFWIIFRQNWLEACNNGKHFSFILYVVELCTIFYCKTLCAKVFVKQIVNWRTRRRIVY